MPEIARHWIGGKWTESDTIGESINPSTGQPVGSFYDGGEAEAHAAVEAAAAAFADPGWSGNHHLRAKALNQIADALEARLPELAATLSQENGKLLAETMWEVGGSAMWLRYSAATALTQIAGRAAQTVPGQWFQSIPEPAGVVGVISPWNSPIILTARTLGPALAAGCTVVIKLPAQTALTNTLLAEAIASVAAIPPGVVNLFTESGNTGAPYLVASDDIAVLSYTGSTAVGRRIAAQAAPSLKRLNLELGGKTPLIVFPDANLDILIPTLVRAATMMNGQFCVTGARVIVHREIADQVRTALSQALENVPIGPWDDSSALLGPLIDRASAERVDRLVAEAAADGTILVRGGLVTEGPLSEGAFYRPSLIEVTDTSVRIVQEEVFGPVQTFEVFEDEADAITKANATEYGLGGSVFTADPIRARRVGRAVQVGLMWTNTWGVLSEHFEEGGVKGSGFGYLCGPRAIEEFQALKVYAEADPTTLLG